MSPQIERDGQLIADVPDEPGLYQALDGSSLWVDLSGIEARNKRQTVILEGPAIGGQRIVGLTQEGKGNSSNLKKGGDGKDPVLAVRLHDRPIRISYSHGRDQGPYHNPRWIRR